MRRLEHGADLREGDRTALAHLVRHARCYDARHVLSAEGDRVPRVLVVLEGWVCRGKALAGGKYQITDLMLPGDACHLHVGALARTDHAVETLTPCTIAEVEPAELFALLGEHPGAARALWWASLQTDSVLRETVVNNGRRQADQRLAHLVCEVHARLRAVGLVEPDGSAGARFAWPLTQEEFGNVTSMTPVHVNRTLKDLHGRELLAMQSRRMWVPDLARLALFAGFRPEYLHLAGPLSESL